MNALVVPIFYASCSVAAVWLGMLWVVARLRLAPCSPWVNGLFGVTTLAVLITPVGGLPIWSWAFSLYPNPSLLLVGMIAAALWRKLSGLPLLRSADWRAAWWFGAVVGSALYLHQMCLGKLDLYYWGWHHDAAIWCMAVLAVAFLACGNRLGVLIFLALMAYWFDALESANGWDYLVDPFFWLISLGVTVVRTIGLCFGWIRRVPHASISCPW